MKKVISLLMIFAIVIAMGACGQGSGGDQSGETGGNKDTKEEKASVELDGTWIDDNKSILIDGDLALYEYIDAYKGVIDREAGTITFQGMAHSEDYSKHMDAVFNYDLIGPKLVLTFVKSEGAYVSNDTMAFEKYEEPEQ